MNSMSGKLVQFLRAAVFATALSSGFLAGSTGAQAQQGRVPVVSDAEIEALMRDYARPILKAAGLSKTGVDIILVNDRSFNAFVVGRRMFINTGAIQIAETPNEIIGVIAHEAGHIAGGHQERLRQQLEKAKTIAIISTLVGIGATAAGAAAGEGDAARAGTGIAAGGAELARRSVLAYQRTEEATADRSAITYLNKTGQSGEGMLKTFKRFQGALSLTGTRVDPYTVSHPMPQDRIQNLQELVGSSPNFGKRDPESLQLRHDMARAKIAAFTSGPSAVQRLARNGLHPLAAQYGDAIATYLNGSAKSAAQKIDKVIAAQPKNPYLHEMRGEIMIKANRPDDAIESLTRAVKLDPSRSSGLQVLLGRAYLAAGGDDNVKRAVKTITRGIGSDARDAEAYFFLAQAYGQLGQQADAELATAEHHYYAGRVKEAKVFAARAQMKFKPGTPQWVRAEDIISLKVKKGG
jgi:predicted Zn-dependent protease